MFAPILVADLNICFDKTLSLLAFKLRNATIAFNANV